MRGLVKMNDDDGTEKERKKEVLALGSARGKGYRCRVIKRVFSYTLHLNQYMN